MRVLEHACTASRLDRSKFLRDAVIGHLRFLGYPPEAFSPLSEIDRPEKMTKNTAKLIGQISAQGNSVVNIPIDLRKTIVTRAKEKYVEGSIGRNILKKNYIGYLIGQYYEFKKADVSFGVDPIEHARIMNGLYPVVNNSIRKHFGAYPNGLEEEKFPSLVAYLHDKIDKTRLGRKQRKAGHSNYKTLEEFSALGQSVV